MRCLVTGGSGFIGTHLLNQLESLGHKVENIDIQIGKDIRDIDKYATGTYDIIYHLAANADVRGGVTDTIVDLENNVIGTHAILEYMRKNGCKNLVFTSSSTVYGERDDPPTKEDAKDLRPISLYGASKLSCENLIHAYCHTFGLKACIFRLGNIIGEGNKRGVISDCIRKIKRDNNVLPILGDGNQIKQYLHYSDCINAFINIPFNNDEYFEVYNVSGKNPLKVNKLVNHIVDELKLDKIKIEYENKDRGWVGDVPVTIIDSSKLCEKGWEQKVTSEDAIRRTTRWANENINL